MHNIPPFKKKNYKFLTSDFHSKHADMQPIFGCWKNMEVGSVATASETHTAFFFGD